MRTGLDFLGLLGVAEAKDLGASFIATYTSVLDRTYAEEMAAAGIDIVLIHEGDGNSYKGGAARGELEAHYAAAKAIDCGMVGGYPIIFAPYDPYTPADNIDSDLSPLLPYFEGVRTVLPLSRIWSYGDFAAVKFLFDHGAISGALQSASASMGAWDDRAQIRQTEYRGAYDVDVAMTEFFGQWRPGVPLHERPPTPDYSYLLPYERQVVNNFMDARKHPVRHRRKLAHLRAEIRRLRTAVWEAAMQDGGTHEAWQRLHREQRYNLLKKLVPPVAPKPPVPPQYPAPRPRV